MRPASEAMIPSGPRDAGHPPGALMLAGAAGQSVAPGSCPAGSRLQVADLEARVARSRSLTMAAGEAGPEPGRVKPVRIGARAPGAAAAYRPQGITAGTPRRLRVVPAAAIVEGGRTASMKFACSWRGSLRAGHGDDQKTGRTRGSTKAPAC